MAQDTNDHSSNGNRQGRASDAQRRRERQQLGDTRQYRRRVRGDGEVLEPDLASDVSASSTSRVDKTVVLNRDEIRHAAQREAGHRADAGSTAQMPISELDRVRGRIPESGREVARTASPRQGERPRVVRTGEGHVAERPQAHARTAQPSSQRTRQPQQATAQRQQPRRQSVSPAQGQVRQRAQGSEQRPAGQRSPQHRPQGAPRAARQSQPRQAHRATTRSQQTQAQQQRRPQPQTRRTPAQQRVQHAQGQQVSDQRRRAQARPQPQQTKRRPQGQPQAQGQPRYRSQHPAQQQRHPQQRSHGQNPRNAQVTHQAHAHQPEPAKTRGRHLPVIPIVIAAAIVIVLAFVVVRCNDARVASEQAAQQQLQQQEQEAQQEQQAATEIAGLPNGTYYIEPYDTENGVLAFDVSGVGDDAYTTVMVSELTQTAAQQITLTVSDDGSTCTLTNSDLYLDAGDITAGSGRSLFANKSDGGDTQRWVPVPNSDGTYSIVSAASDTLAMAVTSAYDGAAVTVEDADSTDTTQHFRIVSQERVETSGSAEDDTSDSEETTDGSASTTDTADSASVEA